MYDNTRYNLARYSVNQENKTQAVDERFSESMGALAGAAVPVDILGRFVETLQGSVRGTVSVISTFSAGSGLFAAANMSADVLTRADLAECVQGNAYGRKNMPSGLAAAETLTASLWGSKNLPWRVDLSDRLGTAVEGSKKICAAASAFEVLTSLLAATSQTTERAVFQLTIPPGGELRIDSELFQVLLDGENALHTQSGDWVNISRELLRLNIESGSGGGLDGQLIYQERYL